LLLPAAVDSETGYRSYDEHNLEVARVIVALRNLEFSLDDIREILAGAAADANILAHLERQREAIAGRLKHFQDVVTKIDELIRHERAARETQHMTEANYRIEERDIPAILVGGIRMKGRYQDLGQGFGILCKKLGRHIAAQPMCLYYDGEYCEADANFEPCVPLRKPIQSDGIHVRELPAARCVTLVHQGPYDELGRSYAQVFKYVSQQGYEIVLPTRETYIKGPGLIFRGNPNKYLTEIQLPIKNHA
jgi:effector-binding domain-containing protein